MTKRINISKELLFEFGGSIEYNLDMLGPEPLFCAPILIRMEFRFKGEVY